MNLHAKLNRYWKKGKYSKIGGTEMLEKEEHNFQVEFSVFQKIKTIFPS